jgi:uncharacterized repeat protein (TIGR01451 family)
MKRLSIVLFCIFALAALAVWVPNAGAFPDFGTPGNHCKECHTIFSGAGADHTTHAGAVGNDCTVCHGATLNIPPLLSDCVKCHLGPGLRAHHENAPFPGPSSCGTNNALCHQGDPAPVPENTVPPGYSMPPATVALDPCDGSEDRIVPNVLPSVFPSAGSFTASLDNDGDLLYDTNDPDCTSADVALTKTASPDPVEVGNNLVYTLSITNNGPDAANVTLDDTLPTNATFVSAVPSQGTCNPPAAGVVSCDLGTVSSGGSATVTITVTPTTQGQITNSATLTGSGNDPDLSNNSDSTTTTVNPSTGPSADISVTKSVDDASPDEGATIIYTITVTNQSSTEDATGVVVTDALPSGVTYVSDNGGGSYVSGTGVWTVGSLTATSSDTLNITATVDAATAGTTITNTATRTASSPNDPNAANDSDTADITPGPFADLSITKTVDVASPAEGDTITYTITVTNNGPDDATGVEVTDLLPSGVTYVSDDGGGSYVSGTGVWSVGSLIASSSGTLNIDATVDSLPEGSSITNTATISASTPIDPDSTDDSASAVITRPVPGGGGGCALIASSGAAAGAAGTFGLLLIAAGWFLVRRRKKE